MGIGERGAAALVLAAALTWSHAGHAHLPEPEPLDCTAGPPFDLTFGGVTDGCAIATPGETDVLAFEADAGSGAWLVARTEDPIELVVALYDPSAQLIDVLQCTGPCSLDPRFEALAEGRHELHVSAAQGATGAYALQVERVLPVAGFITIAEAAETFRDFEVLEHDTDVDWTGFEGFAGHLISIEIESADLLLDPVLEIRDGAASLLGEGACDGGEAPDAGTMCIFTVQVAIAADAVYYFSVTDAGHDESGTPTGGRYFFTFDRLPEPTASLGAGVALAVLAWCARRRG